MCTLMSFGICFGIIFSDFRGVDAGRVFFDRSNPR